MTSWNIEDMLYNVDSFSCQPEVENGKYTNRYVVLAKLSEARLLKRLKGRNRVYGDRVIVATFDNKNDALDRTIMLNNCLLFFCAIERVNGVLDKARYVDDTDYSFDHKTVGKTGLVVAEN